MVIQVRGIRAARIAAEVMQRHTGVATCPQRGLEKDGSYWVSNTYLQPPGEQEVLDRLPWHSLLRCHGCSHQRTAEERQAQPVRMSPHVRTRLERILANQQNGFAPSS